MSRQRMTMMKMEKRCRSSPQPLLKSLPKPTSHHLRKTKIIRKIRSFCPERIICLRKLDSLGKKQQHGKKDRFIFQKPRL